MNFLVFVGIVLLVVCLYTIFNDLKLGLVWLIAGLAFILCGMWRKPKAKKDQNEDSSRREVNYLPSQDSLNTNREQSGREDIKAHCEPVGSPLDHYIVLDIETTGFSRTGNRIIEIAANECRNGIIERQYHTYVNPMVHIPATITQLTGIRDKDVQNAPRICDVKREFLSFIGETPIVGHNISSFDIPFLEAQLGASILNRQYDTLKMAREAFPGLPSYKLSFLDQALHLNGAEHHRAGNDVATNNNLFIACLFPYDYRALLTKEAISKIPIEPTRQLYDHVDIHSIHPTNPDNITHTALTGKGVVFTGELGITRRDAMQLAVDAGAILKNQVSGKVDYLVLGETTLKNAEPDGMSAKQKRALDLTREGKKEIKIIDEAEFMSLLTPIS